MAGWQGGKLAGSQGRAGKPRRPGDGRLLHTESPALRRGRSPGNPIGSCVSREWWLCWPACAGLRPRSPRNLRKLNPRRWVRGLAFPLSVSGEGWRKCWLDPRKFAEVYSAQLSLCLEVVLKVFTGFSRYLLLRKKIMGMNSHSLFIYFKLHIIWYER